MDLYSNYFGRTTVDVSANDFFKTPNKTNDMSILSDTLVDEHLKSCERFMDALNAFKDSQKKLREVLVEEKEKKPIYTYHKGVEFFNGGKIYTFNKESFFIGEGRIETGDDFGSDEGLPASRIYKTREECELGLVEFILDKHDILTDDIRIRIKIINNQ